MVRDVSGAPDVLAMVRAGIDTADAMYAHAYGERCEAHPFSQPVDARVMALHDAIQAAKAAGLILLVDGERGDGARSWWVVTETEGERR